MRIAPWRVAVVGAGPSGFFMAQHLFKGEVSVAVDMFDRLPTPYGLVRFGVSPDHQNIKAVTGVFEKVAAHPSFRYFGNVEIGRDISTDELAQWYDAVVFTHGADRGRLAGIEGEDLVGNHPAADVVAWYNGRPDRAERGPDLTTARAVVIGAGNVALDVARLLTLPVECLARTDVADHALDALRGSAINEVVVLCRRGPEHAAFTRPELRELGALPGVHVEVDGADLPAGSAGDSATARERLTVLAEYADRPRTVPGRTITLRFGACPERVLGHDRVTGIEVTHRGRTEAIPAGLVIHAVGYVGAPLAGIPFDAERGIVPNVGGRILDGNAVIPGHYVAGWIKRGPRGVIGANKACAAETAAALSEDVTEGRVPPRGVPQDWLDAVLAERGCRPVDFAGWRSIDRYECAVGETQGRPRVKVTSIEQMIHIARSEVPVHV